MWKNRTENHFFFTFVLLLHIALVMLDQILLLAKVKQGTEEIWFSYSIG